MDDLALKAVNAVFSDKPFDDRRRRTVCLPVRFQGLLPLPLAASQRRQGSGEVEQLFADVAAPIFPICQYVDKADI